MVWISKSTGAIGNSGKQNYFRKLSGNFLLKTNREFYPPPLKRARITNYYFNVTDIKKEMISFL